MNYRDGRCVANNDKKCLLGDEGAEAEQGRCELHGEYTVWRLEDRVVVTKKGEYPGGEPLGRGINFLTADELAYRKSKKLKVPVDYDLD
jgi:hypothetical protein